MDTPGIDAENDRSPLGRATDSAQAGPAEAEELQRTASLALAKAVRRYRESSAPAFTAAMLTLVALFGRFAARRADLRAAEVPAHSDKATPGSLR